MTENKNNFVSDFVLKGLAGLVTVMMGVAVSSLQNMSSEIKSLSSNVYDLSAQSKVLIVTLDNLERRLAKIEQDTEILKEKAAKK